MKIHPIYDLRQIRTAVPVKTNTSDYISTPQFNGYDFLSNEYSLNNKINKLKDNIDTTILPFKQQYGEKFIRLGQIGFAAQEKLGLISNHQSQLLYKKIYAADNETFKQSENYTADYEEYINNIKGFKHFEELSKKEPYSLNQDILNTIENNRKAFAGDFNEFSKLKTYYDTVTNTKKSMFEELDNINLSNFPVTAKKIKKLNDKHLTATGLLLFPDYILMTDIYKDYNTLVMAYKDKTMPINILWEKIYLLEENLRKFSENDNNRTEYIKEIDKFLEENDKDRTEKLSEYEIKLVYKKLTEYMDNIISKYTNDLKKYNADTKLDINRKLIKKILKSQNSVNSVLASLIKIEKEKLYKKSYEDFSKTFLNDF